MGKISRLVINRLVVVLLISVVFFSSTQQVLSSTEETIPLTYPEALPATYPKLDFSTYFGGSGGLEHGLGIAITEDDNCYVTGHTGSSNFPTQNAYNSTFGGVRDAFVAKLTSSGSLLWSTYLGGNEFDGGFSIAVTSDGSCYIIGITRSSNFPTQNAFDSTYNGKDDTFLAKFSASGQLLWSSYLGGSEEDYGYSIAVASDGSCYVTGQTKSSDFPTKNAYDSTFNGGHSDIFVSKFSSNGALLWSSYLGGNWNDAGQDIAISSDGGCYVTGRTQSSNFPALDAYDSTHNGDWDVFVTKFTASGSLLWSTFFGGAGWDEAWGIAVAGDGSFYITGYTVSNDFPLLNAFNSTCGVWGDAFLTKFSSEGSLLWSTYLGGNGIDRGYDITVASDGSCYVTGETFSTDFPTENALNSTLSGGYDAFVTGFSSEGLLLWSTYLGGSEGGDRGHSLAVTEDGNCFVIGTTHSDDFPTQNAYDNTLGGPSDAFIAKYFDLPMQATHPSTVTGFLVFIAIIPVIAFVPVIALIVYKKRK